MQRGTYNAFPDHSGTTLSNFIESDHDSAPSPPDASLEKNAADSRALVPVAAMDAEALAVVPMRKPKRCETVQRRIRRPFSVFEVEALVQAVEKLGTGRYITMSHTHSSLCLLNSCMQMLISEFLLDLLSHRWRDVKMRAFDNAKHRTYVDLKVQTALNLLHFRQLTFKLSLCLLESKALDS